MKDSISLPHRFPAKFPQRIRLERRTPRVLWGMAKLLAGITEEYGRGMIQSVDRLLRVIQFPQDRAQRSCHFRVLQDTGTSWMVTFVASFVLVLFPVFPPALLSVGWTQPMEAGQCSACHGGPGEHTEDPLASRRCSCVWTSMNESRPYWAVWRIWHGMTLERVR